MEKISMLKRHSKWFALLAAIVVLVLVFMFNGYKFAQQANRPMPVKQTAHIAADVAVVKVTAGSFAAKVEAFGAASPRYNLNLTAQVSGQVLSLGKNFETGRTVAKGELLVQLEDSDYRAALATAENNLATAKVDLLAEQREAEQARAEWQNSGFSGEPDSPLVLRGPQVEAAQAAVNNAEAAVASARKDLAQTKITAPFNGLIISRSISPGSYLQSGGEVAELYAIDRIEVSLSLSQRDWNSLPAIAELQAEQWPVLLTSVETGAQWQGYIQRVEQHLDATSRQQAIIAAVDNPLEQSPILAPGTFVRAQITGREQSGLWQLPPSALSQRGEIWYVFDGLLKSFATETVASDSQAIYIKPPEELMATEVAVVKHPLSSYLVGMAVNPVVEHSPGPIDSLELVDSSEPMDSPELVEQSHE